MIEHDHTIFEILHWRLSMWHGPRSLRRCWQKYSDHENRLISKYVTMIFPIFQCYSARMWENSILCLKLNKFRFWSWENRRKIVAWVKNFDVQKTESLIQFTLGWSFLNSQQLRKESWDHDTRAYFDVWRLESKVWTEFLWWISSCS